jgi:methyl-accepting chemotaxis protein
MKKLNIRKKLLSFFIISEVIFLISFYFVFYPFMGLSLPLIIKGMGPSVSFICVLIIFTSLLLSKISKQLDMLDLVDKENNKIKIAKAEKNIKSIFIFMNIIFFPVFVSIGGFITLFADGLLRWSTIRELVICGLFLGPSTGILQLIFTEYLIKDVKIYTNIIEFEVKKRLLNFKTSFLLLMLVIGSFIAVFSAMVSITQVEQVAGISNVAVRINKNAPVESTNGYFTKLLELSLNSTDENVKTEAGKILNEWNSKAIQFARNSFFGVIFAVILFFLFTLMVAINFTSHIDSIKSRLESIVSLDGDLTQMFVKTRDDEIGEIQVLFNKFIMNLNKIFANIFHTAKNIIEETNNRQKSIEALIKSNLDVIKSNDEMSTEITNLATISGQTSAVVKNFIDTVNSNMDSINNQSSMIEESTASTTEMHASIEAVSKSTETAFKISEELKSSSINTFDSINQLQDIIKEINKNSEGIFEIVSTISNIAEQTDILAINASIEAAHAGESGKGFSVVADEIRNLAENTSGRTKEISEMLGKMKETIVEAVNKSNHASGTINNIQKSINMTIQIINEINMASKEQLVGANENLAAIEQLVTSSNLMMNNLNTQKTMNIELTNVSQKIKDSITGIDEIKKKQDVFFKELSNNFDQFQIFFYNTTNQLNKLHNDFEKLKFFKEAS